MTVSPLFQQSFGNFGVEFTDQRASNSKRKVLNIT